jgi:hypothetical protein
MSEEEKQQNHVYWTTEAEIAYLEKLGEHSRITAASPRPVLLRKYLKAMNLRKNWEGMSPSMIRAYILGELGVAA